jgi:hypothetical protein
VYGQVFSICVNAGVLKRVMSEYRESAECEYMRASPKLSIIAKERMPVL